ncbi:MAG: AAA family ATPase [Burkholderiales bacterium]|nr:AAA family ATPase [Burkholderiales bacterium]
MYNKHFGLREAPFSITPDTSFSFASGVFQEALNTLLIAVKNGEGFIKITGEVGTGKTLLCRKFLASLDESFITAYIPNPYLEPRTLLIALAEELTLKVRRDLDQHLMLKALTLAMLDFARQGKRVLVCLDEAQAMPLETLEALRLLSNLETEKRKLIQVVLFGQPELNDKLELPSLRQLKQRIAFHYELQPLSRDELDYYVAHRLTVAGQQGGTLFSKSALAALYRTSGGVPRLVNIICHKSLLLVFGEGKQQVEEKHIRLAASDTPAAKPEHRVRWWWAMLALLGVGLGIGSWALLR